MKAKPSVTPAMWGSVRRKPYVRPEDISITLLGPGVKNITQTNATKARSSRWEMDMAAGRGAVCRLVSNGTGHAANPALEAGHEPAAEIAGRGIGEAPLLVHQLVDAA